MYAKDFIVTFRESVIVQERVEARSKAEAIRLVKDGQGERISMTTDDDREPTSHKAVAADEEH